MRDIETVVDQFRSAGLKITPQRITIFSLIRDDRNHPCAEDIYRGALPFHPSISFTTVYKTLQTLRDLGEITQLTIDPDRAHFDPVVEDHAHCFCSACRRITDYDGDGHDGSVLPKPARTDGFAVRQVHVHFVGLCGECRPGEA